MSRKVAVVLCGCGRADGSEITEAVSALIHLHRAGYTVRCFAPDAPQAEVINHATGKPVSGMSRNMLVESARISRGDITPIDRLKAADFDAVVFPGGFGVAKNLCDFAKAGSDCSIQPDVERVLKEFHSAKKPIGLICIAPVLAARVFGSRMKGPGCKVTIGTDEATSNAIATMGSQNIPRAVGEAYIDDANRLVTTPAYMFDAKPHEVYEGIGKMVDGIAAILRRM